MSKRAVLLILCLVLLCAVSCGAAERSGCTFVQTCCRGDLCLVQGGSGDGCPFCPFGYYERGCRVECP